MYRPSHTSTGIIIQLKQKSQYINMKECTEIQDSFSCSLHPMHPMPNLPSPLRNGWILLTSRHRLTTLCCHPCILLYNTMLHSDVSGSSREEYLWFYMRYVGGRTTEWEGRQVKFYPCTKAVGQKGFRPC